jgi:hypothetical protein
MSSGTAVEYPGFAASVVHKSERQISFYWRLNFLYTAHSTVAKDEGMVL